MDQQSNELTFYCDKARHLVCVPYSTPHLHAMAGMLKIKRTWFHADHYDIPKRRIAEIEAKCKIVSTREILAIARPKAGITFRAPFCDEPVSGELSDNWQNYGGTI